MSGGNMGDLFYEYKPHLCGILAFYSLFLNKNTLLLNFCGALFLIGSTAIFIMRQEYRKRKPIRAKH